MSWFESLNAEATQRMATKTVPVERSLLNQKRMEDYIIKRQKFEGDFIRGQQDFENGIPARRGKSAVYQRGYKASKQHTENMREMKT